MIRINLILLLFLLSCSNNHYRNQEPQNVDLEVQTTDENNLTSANKEEIPIYVAISAMISPKETFKQYEELISYLAVKLNTEIKLKQRKTYGEVNDLLQQGRLDFAFVCSGAFVEAEKRFPIKILAVPVVNGEASYHAYIIVNKSSDIKELKDLQGKSFAYTDPLSNTGYKFGIKLIRDLGYNPENFFSQTIFTYAHDNSIQAVARRIVEGATIDGLIFDYFQNNNPSRVENIKIIKKSEPFGIPPLVYTDRTDKETIKQIRNVLFKMHKDEEGKRILSKLMIDQFIEGNTNLYDSIRNFY